MDGYVKKSEFMDFLRTLSERESGVPKMIIDWVAGCFETFPTTDVVERSSFDMISKKYAKIQNKIINGELAPVVHAHWVHNDFNEVRCSNCRALVGIGYDLASVVDGVDVCYKCGAVMDEVVNDG